MDYAKNCLANVYIRKAFVFINNSDFINALQSYCKRLKICSPSFKPLNAYIAYSNNKLGNLHAAAKYYTQLIDNNSAKPEYIEAASNIYKPLGDTVSALNIIKNVKWKILPNDKSLILDGRPIFTIT